MKAKFTKEYIMSQRGCYEREDVERLKCINNKTITLKQLIRDLPIKDFSWFLVKKCDLTIKQKQLFALHCAKQVLPIYNKRYPEDKRIQECTEYTELYLNGKGERSVLLEKRSAAHAAAHAAATAAAYAAADAYAAYAAHAAAYAAYAAAAAAATYKKSIWEFVESIK